MGRVVNDLLFFFLNLKICCIVVLLFLLKNKDDGVYEGVEVIRKRNFKIDFRND